MTETKQGASPILLLEWWKPVEGFEGYYEVSNVGLVRRVGKSIPLTGSVTRKGYKMVLMCRPGFRKTIAIQERIFKAVLAECAVQGGRVLSIHSRGAAARTIEMLAQAGQVGQPILHWFSGGASELLAAIRLGCWFSVGPAMLAGEKGRSLAARMPLDRVLPETDGPFATEGGTPLKPWDAWKVCALMSKVWSMPEEDVAAQLKANLSRLLSKQI